MPLTFQNPTRIPQMTEEDYGKFVFVDSHKVDLTDDYSSKSQKERDRLIPKMPGLAKIIDENAPKHAEKWNFALVREGKENHILSDGRFFRINYFGHPTTAQTAAQN